MRNVTADTVMAVLNIVMLALVGLLALVAFSVAKELKGCRAQLEAEQAMVASLLEHVEELKLLSKHKQHPIVCIDVEDMTAREFLWHMRKLCGENGEGGFEIH